MCSARQWIGTFAVALVALGAGDARGEDSPEALAKAHFDKGNMHYNLGRFDEALEEFSAAYEALALPAFLFNLGQCHRHRRGSTGSGLQRPGSARIRASG